MSEAAGGHPDVARYWDEWHDPDPDAQAYLHALDALLAPADVRGRRLLDLGCGTGHIGRVLLERGAAQVVGLDRSAGSLAVSRRARPAIDALQMDLMDAPVLGTF